MSCHLANPVAWQAKPKQGERSQDTDASGGSADASRLRDVVSRCNALGSERPRTIFSTRNLEQDLARLLRSGNVEQHRDILERPLAAAALAGVNSLWFKEPLNS
jgi:DNA mismatch repair protein MSH2